MNLPQVNLAPGDMSKAINVLELVGMHKRLGLVVLFVFNVHCLVGCADLAVMASMAQKPMIGSMDRASASSGDVLSVDGKYLSKDIKVSVNDSPVDFKLSDSSHATLTVPALETKGLVKIIFKYNDLVIKTMPLIIGETDETAILLNPLTICDDVLYRDSSGSLVRGSRNCSASLVEDTATATSVVTSSAPASAAVVPACTATGQTNCIANASYPSVDPALLVPPAACNTDGEIACLANAAYPAARLTNISSNVWNIRKNVAIAGVSGEMLDCSLDNQSDCFTTAAFPSVIKASVSPGVLKSGTTLAGIMGQYPNASYPLAVADGFADLTGANFQTQLAAASSFGWFDRNGVRQSANGEAALNAGNIKTSVTLFGIVGSWGPANCSADGSVSCVTSAAFPSVDRSTYNAWDIRSGKTIGGVPGNIEFFKNMANLTTFNRTAGTASDGSLSVADIYDSIQDDNNGGAFPTTAIGSFAQNTGQAWLRNSLSDSNSNSLCDGGEECVYTDRLTQLSWAKFNGVNYTWENAINHCEGLNYGGYTDWRVATNKEQLQAYIDGIWRFVSPLSLTGNDLWASTTDAPNTLQAFKMSFAHGKASTGTKTSTNGVICVR